MKLKIYTLMSVSHKGCEEDGKSHNCKDRVNHTEIYLSEETARKEFDRAAIQLKTPPNDGSSTAAQKLIFYEQEIEVSKYEEQEFESIPEDPEHPHQKMLKELFKPKPEVLN